MTWTITLDIDDIEIVPYVRMTRRGKFVSKRAQRYLASKDNITLRVKEQMQAQNYDMMPGQTPLWVCIDIHTPTSQGHKCDIDNLAKAVLDACNGVLWPDDRWIDDLSIDRKIGDKTYLGVSVGERSR